MKTDKKAQSMSINTIIVALLALLVMVLLIAILTGKIKMFNTATDTCSSVGGVCDKSTDNLCNEGYIKHPSAKDCDATGKPCCIALTG
jgi:hypothetical protein